MVRVLALCVILAACGDDLHPLIPSEECSSWRQWGNTPAHAGASCAAGAPLRAVLSDAVFDPFVDDEIADGAGHLLVRYPAPLIDGDDVYMLAKRGTYTRCDADGNASCGDQTDRYRRNSQIWGIQHYTLDARGKLASGWSFDSDWKPEPQIAVEPVFQAALAGAQIAIPGAGGSLWLVDRASGTAVRRVQPLGAVIDPDTYVAGGLAVAPDGTIYYNAIHLDHDRPFELAPKSWLVAIAPDGSAHIADYASLVPGAPAATDLCRGTYSDALPWPPLSPGGAPHMPPSAPCGPQRPGINVTPAVRADGTIITVSRAHNSARYAYVVAVGPDLVPRWATSLRDVLRDDCGVTTPSDGTSTNHPFNCRSGTPVGIERETGTWPAGQVTDGSSASPVVLPDGGVLYGAFTGYNANRGHLFKLEAGGAIAATYNFGWDATPAVFGAGLDYRIVIKDNHYGGGPFDLTALDASLKPVWKFPSTNTMSCARQPDGSVACTDDHPTGFEWCVNAAAIDRDGTIYANSEDGRTYAITATGQLRDSVFLDRALGTAYTPIAIDRAGRVFSLNAGRLHVLGN